MQHINKVIYSLFGLVTVVSLALSGYSLYDLTANTWNVPDMLAVTTSIVFDGAAVLFAYLLIERKIAREQTGWLTFWMYLLIVMSAVFNVTHAYMSGNGLAYMVLNAAFPVVSALALHFILGRAFNTSLKDAKLFVPQVSRKARRLDKNAFKVLELRQVAREYEEANKMLDQADDTQVEVTADTIEDMTVQLTPDIEEQTHDMTVVEDLTPDITQELTPDIEEQTPDMTVVEDITPKVSPVIKERKVTVTSAIDDDMTLPAYLTDDIYTKTTLAKAMLANNEDDNKKMSAYATLLGLDVSPRNATQLLSAQRGKMVSNG